MQRLTGVKRNFKNIAFVGPNPYLFLQHMPKEYEVDKFYFCEQNEASVQKSHDIISERVNSNFYEKLGLNLPEEMVPLVLDEESEWSDHFKHE